MNTTIFYTILILILVEALLIVNAKGGRGAITLNNVNTFQDNNTDDNGRSASAKGNSLQLVEMAMATETVVKDSSEFSGALYPDQNSVFLHGKRPVLVPKLLNLKNKTQGNRVKRFHGVIDESVIHARVKTGLLWGCSKEEEDQCEGYPLSVGCYLRSDIIPKLTSNDRFCSCNYLHTLYVGDAPYDRVPPYPRNPKCVRNVFAPCSVGTSEEFPCGENMDCITDQLGITNYKFCRCKEGFAPVPNSIGVYAFCRPIIWTEEESEEVELDSSAQEFIASRFFVLIFIPWLWH